MKSFEFYTPTKVFFGEEAEDNISKVISGQGYKKVLIHYGSERIKASGLFDRVKKQVELGGATAVELGNVQPNPKIGLVRKGVELVKSEGVDFILAVGGGSVADSSKAIRIGAAVSTDPWEAITNNVVPQNPIPLGVVLTMAAAGSEMSNSCVITNDALNLKRGCNHDANRPEYAFMNPVNTVTVPPYQTAAGVVDILMHTMERYLVNAPATPLTDRIAVAILRTVIEQGRLACDEPENVDARAEVMWASSLAHNNLTELGRGGKTFTAHKIEHDLSGMHDEITHGAGLAVVFPAWVLHEYRACLPRFYTWARDVWQAKAPREEGQSEDAYMEAVILDGVKRMKDYFRQIGMPVTMGELGISPAEYQDISALTTAEGTKTVPSFGGPLTQQDVIDIYKLAE